MAACEKLLSAECSSIPQNDLQRKANQFCKYAQDGQWSDANACLHSLGIAPDSKETSEELRRVILPSSAERAETVSENVRNVGSSFRERMDFSLLFRF